MIPARPRQIAARRRGAFTLVELLITISIIAILAAITLFSLHTVTEDAKETQTRSKIHRLNRLLMLRWEGYATRPVPIRTSPTATDRRAIARSRLTALRLLMRMEMPDTVQDVIDGSNLPIQPSLTRSYISRARAIHGLAWQTRWSRKYQGAECLYMIVASTYQGDRNGLDYFSTNDIGDKDGDGMFEILDGWGNPIEFIRWAPGFRSAMQDGNPQKSHDPLDPMPIEPNSFKLHPLIFSAGPDDSYDIHGVIDPDSTANPPTIANRNNPYAATNMGAQRGAGNGQASYVDNVHNHSVQGD